MRPEPQRIIDRKEFPILYVDDERENLRAFELAFRREYQIHVAESGPEALEVINSLPIAVVLSDHRMPEMTGTEFLARAREVDPRTVRLLVTAYGDAQTLADAVNNGAIYRYIAKPWDLGDMRVALAQAVDLYALENERESLLSELTALRSVSHKLASELDLGRLCRLVVHTVVEDLGFDAAALFLDSARGSLQSAAVLPAGDDGAAVFLRDLAIESGKPGLWLEALRNGRTHLMTPDRIREEGDLGRRMITEVAADEILCVPLTSARGPVGLLIVDNRRGGRGFLASERALLEGLGSQVAIALDNARAVSGMADSGKAAALTQFAVLGAGFLALKETAPSLVSDWTDVLLPGSEPSSEDGAADVAEVVRAVLGSLAENPVHASLQFEAELSEIKGQVPVADPLRLALGLLLIEASRHASRGEPIAITSAEPGVLEISAPCPVGSAGSAVADFADSTSAIAAGLLLSSSDLQLGATEGDDRLQLVIGLGGR